MTGYLEYQLFWPASNNHTQRHATMWTKRKVRMRVRITNSDLVETTICFIWTVKAFESKSEKPLLRNAMRKTSSSRGSLYKTCSIRSSSENSRSSGASEMSLNRRRKFTLNEAMDLRSSTTVFCYSTAVKKVRMKSNAK